MLNTALEVRSGSLHGLLDLTLSHTRRGFPHHSVADALPCGVEATGNADSVGGAGLAGDLLNRCHDFHTSPLFISVLGYLCQFFHPLDGLLLAYVVQKVESQEQTIMQLSVDSGRKPLRLFIEPFLVYTQEIFTDGIDNNTKYAYVPLNDYAASAWPISTHPMMSMFFISGSAWSIPEKTACFCWFNVNSWGSAKMK